MDRARYTKFRTLPQYQQIAMKLADAEFSEVRREQIREITRAFGIAPAILFETSRATWSNFEQSHRSFLTNTLRPGWPAGPPPIRAAWCRPRIAALS